MNDRTVQANTLKLSGLLKPGQTLSKSWLKAAGLLRGKKKLDPLIYQKKIRKEWERRFSKLTR